MSTFWIHQDGTVAVDDAVMNGVDVSSMAKNIQLMWWYGKDGHILYSDRLPIREPVTDLESFIPIFNKWILAANTPLPTTSGKTAPAITLAQAKAVKSELVWGLYHNKFAGLTPGTPPGDNTASVNASIQALADSVNTQVNNSIAGFNANVTSLNSQLSAWNTTSNNNLESLNSIHNTTIGSGMVGMINGAGHADPASFTSYGDIIMPAQIQTSGAGLGGMGSVSVSAPPVTPGGAGTGPTDPLADTRTTHLNGVAAQTTVPGVAAYDITTGW